MKVFLHAFPPSRSRATRAGLLALFCAGVLLQGTSTASAQLYWDNNGGTAGFGTATGTWAAPTTNNSTQGWSTDSTGATLPSGTTNTTTSDALNFGTGSAGLAAGTITVSGTVNANSLTFGSASGNITLSGGTITLGGTTPTITVNNTSDTISSVLAGSAGFTKNGSGNLTLTARNSYTGVATVNAGTLILAESGGWNETIKGSLIVNSGGTVQFNQNDQITDASTVTLNGGILNLGSKSDYISTLSLNSGAQVQGDGSASQFIIVNGASGTKILGTGGGNAGTISSKVALTSQWGSATGSRTQEFDVADSTSLTVSGAIVNAAAGAGVGSILKSGNGTLTLTGNNTYSGNTTINAGTLQVSGTGLLGGGSYSANIANSGTFIFGSNSNQTLSGVISRTGALTKNGSGTLTLSNAANTYNGSTTVNAGTLAVSGNISSSALTLSSGGVISAGSAAAVTKFNAASLTISGDSGYAFTIGNISGGAAGTAGTDYDQIATAGGITFNNTISNPFTIYINGNPTNWNSSGSYTWNILSGASISGFSASTFVADTSSFQGALAAGASWTFGTSGGNLTLTYGTSGTPTWAGGTGVWSGNFTPSLSNNLDMLFTGAGGVATNDIASGTLSSVGTITFNSTAGSYTLAANSGSAGNGTALSLAGSIINNSNSTQTINTALSVAATRTINTASGNITIGGAISGAGGLTKTGNSTLSLGGNNTFAGATTISAGTLEVTTTGLLGGGNYSQNIANSATFLFGSNSNQTLGGIISGSGALTKNGTGTFTLTGNNTYSGNTTINAGTLEIGSTGRLGSGTYAGAITNNGSLLFGSNSNQTLSGAISGTGGLTKNGSSTLTLSNTNTYTGGTTINTGTIILSGANAMPTSATVNSGATLQSNSDDAIENATAITLNGGTLALQTYNDYIGNLTLSNNAAVTGTGTGTQNLITNGVANSLISTNGTGNAGTISSRLSLTSQWGAATGARTQQIQVGDNASLTISGVIQDSAPRSSAYTGSILKSGNGTLTLSGNNTYTGATTINVGTLEIAAAGRLGGGSYAGAITNNATLIYSGTNNQTLSGVISGTGALTQNAASTLTLSNASNSYTGLTTVNAGTLALGANQNLGAITGAGALNLSSYTLTTNASTNTTYSGVISGTGALTKNGTGTLTLSGNNTYTGTTTINTGALLISSTGLLGGGNYSANISNSGTFLFASSSNQILGGVISGSGALTKNGSGTLTLAGNNNYSGNTTLNTGTFVIGHANAAGTGKIFQTDSTSLLKIDTTGTITNAMSVYNVLATQSATLSGAITVNNATWDVDTGDTLTISGAVSGDGGVTKNGGGTLVLSGNNTYLAPTVINAGTLNVANANALGANNTVTVNDGTLLVSTDDAINGRQITLNGTSTTVATLAFSGNYTGSIGKLTLSANSIIDLGQGNIGLQFADMAMGFYNLSIYNWGGTTQWGTTYGTDTDRMYFNGNYTASNVKFYSGAVGSDSFVGSGFDLGLQQTSWDSGLSGRYIIPVPEPETWATGILLVLGGGAWLWRKRKNFTTQSNLEGAAPSAPIEKMVGLFRRNDPNQRQSRPHALPAKSARI